MICTVGWDTPALFVATLAEDSDGARIGLGLDLAYERSESVSMSITCKAGSKNSPLFVATEGGARLGPGLVLGLKKLAIRDGFF